MAIFGEHKERIITGFALVGAVLLIGVIDNFGTGMVIVNDDGTNTDTETVFIEEDTNDASGKTFTIQGGTTDEYDGKSILVNYDYVTI